MCNDAEMAKRYLIKSDNAAKKGNIFDLSFAKYKRLMNQKRCAYSGLEFADYVPGNSLWASRTLDRIDNSIGYTDKNTVAVCNGVNIMKGVWENSNNPLTEDLVLKIIKSIARKRV